MLKVERRIGEASYAHNSIEGAVAEQVETQIARHVAKTKPVLTFKS